MVVQDPKPAPQAAKKKKGKKGTKVRHVKPINTGLEDFMGWANPTLPTRETQGDRPIPQISRELVEKSENDMSSLAVGFAARMRKRATSAQGETTPGFEVPGGKRPKWSSLNEEIQKSLIVITSDSLERASSAFSTLEGATKDASREACASLEDGNLVGGPPSADKVVGQAPSAETTVGSPLLDRRSSLVITSPCRPRGLDKLVLNSPIKPMKWIIFRRTRLFLVHMLLSQLLTAGTPLTRGTLLSPTCTNSTPPTFEYQWWLFVKSISFPSLSIWIKNPTNV